MQHTRYSTFHFLYSAIYATSRCTFCNTLQSVCNFSVHCAHQIFFQNHNTRGTKPQQFFLSETPPRVQVSVIHTPAPVQYLATKKAPVGLLRARAGELVFFGLGYMPSSYSANSSFVSLSYSWNKCLQFVGINCQCRF